MKASRNLVLGALIAIVVAGFFGFTRPGQRVLSALGFVAACNSDNC
jgi:hypothetical protein